MEETTELLCLDARLCASAECPARVLGALSGEQASYFRVSGTSGAAVRPHSSPLPSPCRFPRLHSQDSRRRSSWMSEADVYNAAETGEADRLERLLAEGAPITHKDEVGNSPLHAAAAIDSAECVKLLLRAGAELDGLNAVGDTPLLRAMSLSKWAAAKELINSGADIAKADQEGNAALHLAAFRGAAETVQLLLERGASLKSRTRQGKTALHEAAAECHLPVLKMLLLNGADWDARDNVRSGFSTHVTHHLAGRGPLYYVATSPKLVRTSVERVPGPRDHWGQAAAVPVTVISLVDGPLACLKALLDAGANPLEVAKVREARQRTQDGTSVLEAVKEPKVREALLAHTCTRETQLTRVSADVLASGLREQFESGDPILLDVALKAEDQTVRVHGAVMAAHGSFWRALVAGPMSRANRTYNLEDITYPQLRMLVDFCYAGRLQAGLATDELLTVLGLAHQYHMQHLMDIIVARLAGLVALTDDIFAIYAAALKLELWDLVKTVEDKACNSQEAKDWWGKLITDDERWGSLCSKSTSANTLMRVFMCTTVGSPSPTGAGAKRKR